MSFELTDERATDVLIWWVAGADGSIDYREEKTVNKVLEDINYSLATYYEETMMHLGSLSTENLNKLVDRAIEWGRDNFDEYRKKRTVALLHVIAECNGEIKDREQKKIDRIKKAFGLKDLEEL